MVQHGNSERDRIEGLVAAMEAVVADLDPVTRDVFVLHRLDGWPYERIAHVREISVAEVERHLAEAVAALDRGLREVGL